MSKQIKRFINSASESELLFLRDKTIAEKQNELEKAKPDYLYVALCEKVVRWSQEALQALDEVDANKKNR